LAFAEDQIKRLAHCRGDTASAPYALLALMIDAFLERDNEGSNAGLV
jgi:hypothetical protein